MRFLKLELYDLMIRGRRCGVGAGMFLEVMGRLASRIDLIYVELEYEVEIEFLPLPLGRPRSPDTNFPSDSSIILVQY